MAILSGMTIRSRVLLFMLVIVALTAGAYTYIQAVDHRMAMLEKVDARLLTAARCAEAMLPADYHDRIVDRSSVSPEAFAATVKKFDALCVKLDLSYIWSVMILDGKFVFTTATSKDKDNPVSECAAFLDMHTNPDAYADTGVFDDMAIKYSSFHDKWGTGRMVLIPHIDTHGRKHLFAASVQLDELNSTITRGVLKSLAVSAGIVGFGVLLSILFSRTLSTPIVRLTRAVEDVVSDRDAPEIAIEGSQEISVLTRSVNAMRRTIWSQMGELQESEQRFRNLFEHSPLAYQSLDENGYIIEANQAWLDLLGYSRQEIIEQWFGNFLVPESVEDFRRNFPCFKEAGATHGVEFQMLLKDGTHHTIMFDGQIGYDAAGNFQQTHCILSDITERKIADDVLHASEERFRRLFEQSNDAIFIHTLDGAILDVNEMACEVLGYTKDELLSMSVPSLHPEDELGAARDAMRVTGDESSTRFESVFRKADGSLIDVDISASVIDSETGVVQGIVRDITDRKQAEDALREASQLNQQIILSAQEGIIVYDSDLKYLVWNPFMERVTGLSADEVRGRHPLEVFPFLREAGVIKSIEQALAGQTPAAVEYPYDVPLAGRKGWASDKSSPLRDAKGEIVGVIATVHDITERKQSEEKLRQAQKMEAVGMLAGGIAHDFRNQLTVIQGYSERLLRKSLVTEDGREAVEEILKASKRSATITGQLLAFSRQEMLRPKTVDLNELISDIAKSLPQMIGEDIRMSIVLSNCPCRAKLDTTQLQQAIFNLAVNARKAMPRGGELVIETSCIETDASFCQRHTEVTPGPYVALSVSDTGCGMDAETLRQIFDPFFTTRDVDEGTGLGLSMVHGFVMQSDGAIEVDSEPGKGSVFRLYFPQIRDAIASVGDTQAPEDIPRGSETILLVEDEAPIRHMLAIQLREFGYTIIEAGSAVEALPLAEHYDGRIDALITDLVMPGGMYGGELAARVKRARPEIAVMYITGYKGADLTKHGLEGVDEKHLLIKPFDPEAVIRNIREILDSEPPSTEL